MPSTVVVLLDPLLPPAVRARVTGIIEASAPAARVVVPDTPSQSLDRAEEAEVAAGWELPDGFTDRARDLRWIHAFTAGVDHFLGLPGVRDGRIVLTRTVGAHAALPEHVMALVLAFSRRLHVNIRRQLAGRWDRPGGVGGELRGQVMGILGLGQLGQAVARLAAAFGMRVIGTKRTPVPVPYVDRVLPPEQTDQVLREADYVVVLLPEIPATRGLLGEREFRLMKPTAVFINVARGAVVQEPALLRALRDGRIAGAGLDVFDQEPLPPDHPFYTFEQVIITPHVAPVTPQFFDRIAMAFGENLRRYVAGEPLRHVIDVSRGY